MALTKYKCRSNRSETHALTHWGRVTHICVSKLTIIGSDNGLAPGRRQAIIWTNAAILLIRTLGTNFSKILGKIHLISLKKMHLKMSSAKRRLFSLGLNKLSLDVLQYFVYHFGWGLIEENLSEIFNDQRRH